MGFFENIIDVWEQAHETRIRIGKRECLAHSGCHGITDAKKEGDGTTPAGLFALRRVFYRADRIARPQTSLPIDELTPDDGWCDDPDDPKYNQWVRLPYRGRAEKLWREDGLYDIIIVIGFNDAPARAGLGSAIFIHRADPRGALTQGCIALALDDLRALLKIAEPETKIRISRARQK